MATLALTAVGTIVGGPIGGAIGALAGQAIDRVIFAPKGRKGPRLGELAVQTSHYGTQIPKIFGTMRVAGTVIWATDLKEHRQTSGGKGRPSVTTYSYSASFAVVLSARPLRAVRRIWADGKLLRGAAGDWKAKTAFRFHSGNETQTIDPAIAAAEGLNGSPAFRGQAYVVFDNLDLTDFGNRIPSLTFEIEADAGALPAGEIAAMLSDGLIADGGTTVLTGFAASGESVRGAIAALLPAPTLRTEPDGTLLLGGTSAVTEIEAHEPGARDRKGEGGESEIAKISAMAIPNEVSITYHDAARDYQTGLQRARATGPGQRATQIQLPAVIDAGAAKALAEQNLAEMDAGRTTMQLYLDWRRMTLRAGAVLRVPGRPGRWRVKQWTIAHMLMRIELARLPDLVSGESVTSPGRPTSAPDDVHGPTRIVLADLPILTDASATQPRLFAFAGGGAGWRRAAQTFTTDDGQSWQNLATRAPAIIGEAANLLPFAGAALIDTNNAIEVHLADAEAVLLSCNDQSLAMGTNLALLGRELIQFGHAEQLDAGRWRLSRLLRGRRGTDAEASRHEPGEAFVLIEEASAQWIDAGREVIGGMARVMASGVGDSAPAEAMAPITGSALRPPSPVHLSAVRQSNGDIVIQWVRRSRHGWTWGDGADAPLGEEREAYRISIGNGGFARTVDLAEPRYRYAMSEQAEDGAAGSIQIEILQLGTYLPSLPATLVISI